MITYKINSSTKEEIEIHLLKCSDSFIPPLSSYVNIEEYTLKIYNKANRVEAYYNNELIGLIASYSDEKNNEEFISNVSVNAEFRSKNIASDLMNKFFNNKKYDSVILEVNENNSQAIHFYIKHNFKKIKTINNTIVMKKELTRNYNLESKDTLDHKYAYSFDFDVMHHYMIKSFKPFFRGNNVLELGSFKGDFTQKLIPFFKDITCVEASNEAINEAKIKLGTDIIFINSLFEDAVLPKKYDNIILTHVLEHLNNPVEVLKKINDEWLSENGKLFIACPNANAPSRQIAVKMGIVSHNTAVTPAEKEHGHTITYTIDTLERDAKAANLRVVLRSGIFFKALANFQWDRLLQTDIISKEYLEGCFELGQQYPDLCSSIFILCEKNNNG